MLNQKSNNNDHRIVNPGRYYKRPIFVLDTNTIINGCLDAVLASEAEDKLTKPNINLSNAILVIPSAVIRELDKFKKEYSSRGHASIKASRLLNKLTDELQISIEEVYHINKAIRYKNLVFVFLPISKTFKQKQTLFIPSENDMDGQIILSALAAREHLKRDVTILTNDNNLKLRSFMRGIKTSEFSYDSPTPYSGRRDIVVPNELYNKLISGKKVPIAEWKAYMRDESELHHNEYIAFFAKEPAKIPGGVDSDYQRYRNIARVDLKSGISLIGRPNISTVSPRNYGQAMLMDAISDSSIKCVVCSGPAGTGKTYVVTAYCIEACRNGEYLEGVTVYSNTPGPFDHPQDSPAEKEEPAIQNLKNAIESFAMGPDHFLDKFQQNQRSHSKPGKKGGNPSTDLSSFGGEEIQLNRRDFKSKEEFRKARKAIQQAQGRVLAATLNNAPATVFASGKDPGDYVPHRTKFKKALKGYVDYIWDNYFGVVLPTDTQNANLQRCLVVADDTQNRTKGESESILLSVGEGSKLIILGNTARPHTHHLDKYNNGLAFAKRQLIDNPFTAQITLTPEEIARSEFVRSLYPE